MEPPGGDGYASTAPRHLEVTKTGYGTLVKRLTSDGQLHEMTTLGGTQLEIQRAVEAGVAGFLCECTVAEHSGADPHKRQIPIRDSVVYGCLEGACAQHTNNSRW